MSFIQLMVDSARDWNCVLLSSSRGQILEPVRGILLEHLVRSTDANEVWDWLRDPNSFPKGRHAPRVFLSHSSLDKPFVSRLALDLRSENVPVWYDKWELKVGDSLTSKIGEGLKDSGWLAVVISKNSITSSWVQRELSTALALELQQKDVFVLPIVIDDCEVPTFLLDKVYADFRTSYEAGLHALLARVLE